MRNRNAVAKILEILQGISEASISAIEISLGGPIKINQKAKDIMQLKAKPHFKNDWAHSYQERHKLYSLLYYLQKQGLVQKTAKNKLSLWRITKQGREKIKKLELKKQAFYLPQKDGRLRLVIFDVPEIDRSSRDWLRRSLMNYGYTLLQKSVWQGDRPLPAEFIKEIKKRRLIQDVHIFEVVCDGTMGIKDK